MLRARDIEPIQTALDKLKNRHNQQVALFHKLEQIRDRLIDNGDDAVAEVLNLWPDADRQQLRSLIRNAKKEKEGNKPPKSARLIFQYLRELAYAFHTWYANTPVLVEDADLRDARLALALAVRQALANGLDLLGVSAPERM